MFHRLHGGEELEFEFRELVVKKTVIKDFFFIIMGLKGEVNYIRVMVGGEKVRTTNLNMTGYPTCKHITS